MVGGREAEAEDRKRRASIVAVRLSVPVRSARSASFRAAESVPERQVVCSPTERGPPVTTTHAQEGGSV